MVIPGTALYMKPVNVVRKLLAAIVLRLLRASNWLCQHWHVHSTACMEARLKWTSGKDFLSHRWEKRGICLRHLLVEDNLELLALRQFSWPPVQLWVVWTAEIED
mmetsp:Transcript_77661/g.137016  ORF Transcript_77661/g.137016 Transcript_77661/m.137016 type:complete len:105 (+) Transcript_77661:96-410(+)